MFFFAKQGLSDGLVRGQRNKSCSISFLSLTRLVPKNNFSDREYEGERPSDSKALSSNPGVGGSRINHNHTQMRVPQTHTHTHRLEHIDLEWTGSSASMCGKKNNFSEPEKVFFCKAQFHPTRGHSTKKGAAKGGCNLSVPSHNTQKTAHKKKVEEFGNPIPRPLNFLKYCVLGIAENMQPALDPSPSNSYTVHSYTIPKLYLHNVIYTTVHYITLHYTTLHCIHYTTLHYTTLHRTAPHCTTLHYITLQLQQK